MLYISTSVWVLRTSNAGRNSYFGNNNSNLYIFFVKSQCLEVVHHIEQVNTFFVNYASFCKCSKKYFFEKFYIFQKLKFSVLGYQNFNYDFASHQQHGSEYEQAMISLPGEMAHSFNIRFVRCRPGFESGRELEREQTTQLDRFLTLDFRSFFRRY